MEIMPLWLAQVLQAVRGTAEVEAELAEIRKAAREAKASSGGLVLFRRRRHLPQLLWCIAMPIMQQYTGINAFMFYGERAVTAGTMLWRSLLCIHGPKSDLSSLASCSACIIKLGGMFDPSAHKVDHTAASSRQYAA